MEIIKNPNFDFIGKAKYFVALSIALILASLAEGDKHGYAILTDVKTFAGVELGAGTLYAEPSRLGPWL